MNFLYTFDMAATFAAGAKTPYNTLYMLSKVMHCWAPERRMGNNPTMYLEDTDADSISGFDQILKDNKIVFDKVFVGYDEEDYLPEQDLLGNFDYLSQTLTLAIGF